jgi:hypothetical protein
MPAVTIDPTTPIDIRAVFDTPLRITLSFMRRSPGETRFVPFFDSAVAEDVPSQDVRCRLDPQARGTLLLLMMVFFGRRKTAFKGTITISQNGAQIGKTIPVNGTTGEKFVKASQVDIELT